MSSNETMLTVSLGAWCSVCPLGNHPNSIQGMNQRERLYCNPSGMGCWWLLWFWTWMHCLGELPTLNKVAIRIGKCTFPKFEQSHPANAVVSSVYLPVRLQMCWPYRCYASAYFNCLKALQKRGWLSTAMISVGQYLIVVSITESRCSRVSFVTDTCLVPGDE